jgi:hypothetical protein
MNPTEALDHAIAAHAKWKSQLREAIDTGKSEWAVRDVRTDNACEFGKWLSALPLSQRLSERYPKVRALHAEFHTVAAAVLGGYGYTPWGAGGYGWNYTVPNQVEVSNFRQVGNLCSRNAATEKAYREATWKNIAEATQTVRRKMVAKYQVEF